MVGANVFSLTVYIYIYIYMIALFQFNSEAKVYDETLSLNLQ